MSPFFSIILPTYNRAHFLPKAIESVLGQTYADWELIIVDDGSTDNTKEVVAAYADSRVVYHYQQNQERSAARNNGIKRARGLYVCFLDSDDYFLPEKLSTLKKAIEQTAHDEQTLFYDGLIFESKARRSKALLPEKNTDETLHEFLIQKPIGPLQVCGPKSIFLEHAYNPDLRIGEDVELWLRMAETASFNAVHAYETVVQEHEDRSVNLKKYNSAKEQLTQLDIIFALYSHQQISLRVRRNIKSNCYFNSAKHFMMNNKKWNAIKSVFLSIFTDPQNKQIRHRIFTLLTLLTGRIPEEYNFT